MSEEKVVQQVQDSDEKFINSLLGTDEPKDEAAKAEEAQRIKNKNAEEARKRREAEAKQTEAKVEEPKAEVKEEVKVEEKKPEPVVEEVKEEPKKDNVNRLGQQLVQFKQKYPQVDLEQLDNDKVFKRYIDGKLLGSKNFTDLYEEFVAFKSELSGVESQVIQRNYVKAQSSSGSSTSTSTTSGDVYSEDEMRQISSKLPLMNPRDVAKVEEKLKRSIAYYDKK